jgi:NAD-dependent dihydropyrimidine dehydrogenase PreA subunit
VERSEEKIKEMLGRKIDPVYSELAAKIGEADSKVMPHVFEALVDLEQAKVLNELPAPAEDIAKKFGLGKETVESHIQLMFEKGLLFLGKTGWHLTRSWGSMHDSVGAAHPKYDEGDFFDLAYAKHEESNRKQYKQVESGESPAVRQVMRVIPRWRSIKDVPGVLPHEDVSAILKHAEPIALINCACKKIDRDRECRDEIPTETCITIGRSGQYNLNRGAGVKLSYEEALRLMDDLDEHPLVHLTGNTNQMPSLLCNCCRCCCGVFVRNTESRKLLDQYALAKSRFIALEDAANCLACGLCMARRCPVGAIRMKYYPELGEERAYTDPEECIGCGLCVVTCPAEARKMKLVRPPEHVPQPGGAPYATV